MTDQMPPGFTGNEVIGRGGFAVVYLAVQDAVNREVAIKILDEVNLSDDVQRRFRRECVAVGSLSWHPHIAQVFDAGVNASGRNYMVLEYLPNGSLADRLEDGPLDEATSLEYTIQIADAVHAAHTEGVLHRDIKPDNVMLDRLGRAKLADFGIADMRDGTKTATGTVTATILYAAPEVLGGERASAASDVYGLGATLHTLLAGRAPFETDTKLDLIALIGRIVTADPVDLRTLGASEGTASAVAKSLGKTAAERHPTALDFGRALQEAQRAGGFRVTPMPFADRRVKVASSEAGDGDGSSGATPTPAAQQSPATTAPPSSTPSNPPRAAEPTRIGAIPSTTESEPAERVAEAPPVESSTQPSPGSVRPDTGAADQPKPGAPPSSAPKKSRLPLLAGLGLLVAAIGIGAWFFVSQRGSDTDDDSPTPVAVATADSSDTNGQTETANSGASLEDLVGPTNEDPTEAPPTPAPTPAVNVATGLGIDHASNSSLAAADCTSFDLFAPFNGAPTCHRLTVPEDWSAPAGSAQVSIPVAVFPSTSGTASGSPLLYIAGGPGTHALSLASLSTFFDPVLTPLLADHDVIVFDQRGTGNATPRLACTEYDNIGGEEVVALIRATDDCFARLTASGIDLTQYSSIATVHDIEALRLALGFQQWQVFGQSYGTRVGLTYARVYSESIDAMVLDAVRPPDYNITASRAPDFERSMELVFQSCLDDPICAETYPNLRDRFFAIVEQLSLAPIEVPYVDAISGEQKTQPVSDVEFLLFTHAALYAPDSIWAIPAMILELEGGGSTVIAQFIQRVDSGLAFVTAGQLIVVNCNDDIVFEDPGSLVAQRPQEPVYARIANSPTSGFSFEDCDSIDASNADPIENQPVESNVDTLLLGGRFDPVLPPDAITSTATRLPNSTTVIFDFESHTVAGSRCGLTLIVAYLANPTETLDTSCVDEQPEITFG